MAKFSIYNIQLLKLSQGDHLYEFTLDRKFFEKIDGDEVKKGDVKVELTVTKTISTYDFNFDIKGIVQIPCTRCLDDMDFPIDTQNKLMVKLGETYSEESDEVVIIPEDEGEINIAWFLYEFISLSIPIKHVHEQGKCNRAMSSKFRKHRAISKNDEHDEDLDDEMDFENEEEEGDNTQVDPRWESLRGLTFDEEN